MKYSLQAEHVWLEVRGLTTQTIKRLKPGFLLDRVPAEHIMFGLYRDQVNVN